MQSLLVILLVPLLLLNVPTAALPGVPLTPCASNGLSSSYDAIVVGSGPGGSVAARRLAEYNPTWKILLLERGIAYAACATCQSSQAVNTLSEQDSGPYIFTTPQPNVAGTPMLIKDAAVQGGGTSVNTGYHLRGDAPRYYADSFPLNWNWGIMQYYYQKYENYTFPANFHKNPWTYSANLRSNRGPVTISQQPLRPFAQLFLNATKTVYPNVPIYYDRSTNDGLYPGIGGAPSEIPAIGTTRVSSYTAYISSYTKTNIKSVTNVLVNKIIFTKTAAVSGINITFNTPITSLTGLGSCVINSKRIIVSAGAYGTPKLLKLSGVGPAAELRRFGIPVVSDIPNVGANLDDHFTLFSFYAGYKDNLLGQNFPDTITSTTYNTQDRPSADLEFMINTSAGGPGQVVLTLQKTNMHSRGNVTLASTNPADPPVINPNYFADPRDKTAAGVALFKLRQIARLSNLTGVNDPCTGSDCSTPSATLATYLQKGAYFVGLHYTGTAAICDVVNPKSLRVYGTSGLYVLDASIMPDTPAAAPMASIYAVAERGIDLISSNMHLDSAGAAVDELIGWAYCALDSF